MPQTTTVQQGDGRKDATGLALHKSAQAIKDFSKRIPFSHPLEDSPLNGEQGFCACALRYQLTFRTTSRSFPFYPAGARSGNEAWDASIAGYVSRDGKLGVAAPRPLAANAF